jgi:hypothetical protein
LSEKKKKKEEEEEDNESLNKIIHAKINPKGNYSCKNKPKGKLFMQK